MIRTVRFFAAVGLVLLVGSACASNFRFVHTSDTHFGAGNNHQINAHMFREIASLDPRPALLVNTGDVCEIGHEEQYQQLRDATAKLGGIPIYHAPGNHDVRWNPRGKEGFVKGTGTPLFRSWDYKNFHFVTLDSTVLLEHWGHISQAQLDWLKEDLRKVGPDRPVVIGFHHWIGREAVGVDNQEKLLEVVAPYNVRLWLQGHGHSDIDWNVNGAPAIMVKGLYQGSYAVIDVNDTEMVVSRRALPQVGELLQTDKEAAETVEAVELTELMRIPLARPVAPKWDADLTVNEAQQVVVVTAQRGDLPDESVLRFRISGQEQFRPMESHGDRWVGRIDISEMLQGDQAFIVHATLPDKRAYHKVLPIRLTDKIAPAWETAVGGAVQSRITRDADTLYVPSMGNDVVALNARDGSEKWRVTTGGAVFSVPHVDNGTVYFGSEDHHIYAVDAQTGRVKWKTQTGGAVLAGPNVAQGIVCVGSADTKIYGLDALTGAIIWTVKGMNLYQSKTATDGERFFVGGWDNYFRCIDARSGKELWANRLGRPQRRDDFSAFAPAITSPTVGNGKVYCSTNDGILHAMNISDGSIAWQIDKKKMGYSSPLFHDGKIYCTLSDDGVVFCADADTGEIIWEAETGRVYYDSSCAYGGGHIFIGAVATLPPKGISHQALLNGILFAIDANNGQIKWQYRLPTGHLLATPAADDEFVYASSMSGIVTALPINPTGASEEE